MLPGEMLPQGLGNLGRSRKMDETVAQIVRAATIHALPFRLAPGRGRTDFVDLDHLLRRPVCPLSQLLSLLGFLVFCGSQNPGATVKATPPELKTGFHLLREKRKTG